MKLFRKIRHSLFDQNRFTKYLFYSIGEILLVVLGILIALQLNKWNEEQSFRVERNYLIAELLTEFEGNLTKLQKSAQINKSILAKDDSVLEELPKLNFPGDEQKLSELLAESRVINIASFNPSEGMINSMANTSNFQHITNKNLRRNLLNWSGYVNDLKENENEVFLYRASMADYLSSFSVFKGSQKSVKDVTMKGGVVTNPLELRNRIMYIRTLKNYVLNEAKTLSIIMEKIIQQLKEELTKN
jgi:hypothetical protein